jgi:hypothetical protein
MNSWKYHKKLKRNENLQYLWISELNWILGRWGQGHPRPTESSPIQTLCILNDIDRNHIYVISVRPPSCTVRPSIGLAGLLFSIHPQADWSITRVWPVMWSFYSFRNYLLLSAHQNCWDNAVVISYCTEYHGDSMELHLGVANGRNE